MKPDPIVPRSEILTVAISSSSKKAGKSTLASRLVKELGADFGLKVSPGGRHAPPGDITVEPEVLGRTGTDTGALLEAGAGQVVWLHPPRDRLREKLAMALQLFKGGGVLVVEGNSVLKYLEVDFAVFLMNVPFDAFKPSALAALAAADLVLVDLSGKLDGMSPGDLRAAIEQVNPDADILFYRERAERDEAWRLAVEKTGNSLGR